MKRRWLLWSAALGAARMLAAQDAPMPLPPSDSVLRSFGCEVQTAAQYQRLSDSLGGTRPYVKTLLDSAGIRVRDKMRSGGVDSSDGSVRWCPTHSPVITFARASIWLVDGSRPARMVDGHWTLLSLLDSLPLLTAADSSAAINRGYDTWQAAVAALAPIYHTAGPTPRLGDQYRVTVVERQGAANSVQLSEVELLDSVSASPPWPGGVTIENPGGASPDSEMVGRAIDGDSVTKWLDFNFAPATSSLIGRSVLVISTPIRHVTGYRWRTANDEPTRDPKTILLDWSTTDGATWVRLDSVTVPATVQRFAWVTRTIPPRDSLPPVVVVVPPPVVTPPGADRCLAAPFAQATATDGTVHRDDSWIPLCGWIVTLTPAGTFQVFWPPCSGAIWRAYATKYTTRSGALARAKKPPACPAR